jgi:hypothetical protein
MLQALNPFAKAPEPPPPPSPGLIGFWSRDQVARALASGNCNELAGLLPNLVSSLGAVAMSSAHVCHGASADLACGGAASFATTLLMLHGSNLGCAKFVVAYLCAIAPHVPRGSFVSVLRPLLDALAAVSASRADLDATNAQKWFYQAPAPHDQDAARNCVRATLFVAADFFSSGHRFADAGSVDAFASAFDLVGRWLPMCAEDPTLAGVVKPCLAALELRRCSIVGDGGVQRALDPAEDAFAALVFDTVRTVGRRQYASDVASMSRIVGSWLRLRAKGATRSKVAAAAMLAAGWKAHVMPSSVEHVRALVAAMSTALRAGADAGDVTAACVNSLGSLFSATAFPPVEELDASVFTFFRDELVTHIIRREDAAATAQTLRTWFGLTSNKTLPQPQSVALRACCVHTAVTLLSSVLQQWPCGLRTDRDDVVVCTMADLAALLSTVGEREVSAADVAALNEALLRATTTTAFHYLPAAITLQLTWLEFAHSAEPSTVAIWVANASAHIARLVRGAGDTDVDSSRVCAEAVQALNAVRRRGYCTPAVARELSCGIMAMLDATAARPAAWSAVTAQSAVVVQELAEDARYSHVIAGLAVAQLRVLSSAYERERGWLFNGPAVAALDRAFLPGGKVATDLRRRRDLREAIAYRDPAVLKRSVVAILCLERIWRKAHGGASNLPKGIARRLWDYCGDGAAVAAAFDTPQATSRSFLLAIA